MDFSYIIALAVFAVIGPVPIVFHLLLHVALAFWRRHVRAFYGICGIVWVAWAIGTWMGASWLTTRVLTPPSALVTPVTVLALLVLCIAAWTIATIGWQRFFVYAVLRPEHVPTMARVTSGPFRLFRHPAYTSYRIAAILLMIATGSWGMVLLATLSLALFPIIIHLEERELRLRVASATL